MRRHRSIVLTSWKLLVLKRQIRFSKSMALYSRESMKILPVLLRFSMRTMIRQIEEILIVWLKKSLCFQGASFQRRKKVEIFSQATKPKKVGLKLILVTANIFPSWAWRGRVLWGGSWAGVHWRVARNHFYIFWIWTWNWAKLTANSMFSLKILENENSFDNSRRPLGLLVPDPTSTR